MRRPPRRFAPAHDWRIRYAPQLAFVRARLSLHGHFGLRVTLGAAVLIAAAWTFGGIAEEVAGKEALTRVDVQLAQWLHAHAVPWLSSALFAVTQLHGTLAVSLYVALLAALFARRGRWDRLFVLVAVVPGGMGVNVLMKQAFQRARPSFGDALLTLHSYSFPSGHTAASTLLYGFLVALVFASTPRKAVRAGVLLAAAAMVVLVGFSRMYLGVHYLSDVLAAMLEGIAWLALCLTGTRMLRDAAAMRRARTP